MPNISITTLGCRVNQYESDAISELLRKDGFTVVPFGDPADIVIVNTCTVTAESDRKSRQLIRRAAALGEGTAVIVTGCFAQVAEDRIPLPPNVAAVFGNGDKEKIPAAAHAILRGEYPPSKKQVSPILEAKADTFTLTVPNRTRSYIKIEDGCENRCAYCIIPKARGKVRSKPMEAVLSEIRTIAATGAKEIILTGIETASYGRDLYPVEPYGTRLAALLTEVDKIEGIERIGLGSLEPTVMTPAFTKTAAGLRHLLPHFHLSIQSGSTTVLNRMRRRYTAERAKEAIERMRSAIPDATFSADVIVGFPGETDAEFEETRAFCQNIGFLHLHIFPYSIREGTEAAAMPDQISPDIKRARLKLLEETDHACRSRFLTNYVSAHMEKPVFVLVEKSSKTGFSGHSEHFAEVHITSCTNPPVGSIVPVFLTSHNGTVCFG